MKQHILKEVRVGGLLLLVILASLHLGSALCSNQISVWMIKFYFGPHNDRLPILLPGCEQVALQDRQVQWKLGFREYLDGQFQSAERDLSAGLTGQTALTQMLLMDQLLTFAPLVARQDPKGADFAVEFARRNHHSSPIGYIELARFYISQTRAGDTANWERAREVARLASDTNVTGYVPRISRAEALFYLGDLWIGIDDAKAVSAYRSAIAEDPQDSGWGYAWMSAMQLVEIYARRQDWSAAREVLAYAETLPDLYHRYSYTRLRLAQLESQEGQAVQAMSILETALERDPGFVPARLYLATLYAKANRSQEAIRQYQTILNLDPNQAQAREALVALGALQ